MFNVVSACASTSSNSFFSTFNSQCFMQCFFHQTNYSLKLFTSIKCSTKIESLLDIPNPKRTTKIFWPVDHLNPFISCLGGLCGVSIYYFRKSFSFNSLNAFMNSPVVWSGSNTRWIASVKLHVKNMSKCFYPLFLLWYMIGLAEKGLVIV